MCSFYSIVSVEVFTLKRSDGMSIFMSIIHHLNLKLRNVYICRIYHYMEVALEMEKDGIFFIA